MYNKTEQNSQYVTFTYNNYQKIANGGMVKMEQRQTDLIFPKILDCSVLFH